MDMVKLRLARWGGISCPSQVTAEHTFLDCILASQVPWNMYLAVRDFQMTCRSIYHTWVIRMFLYLLFPQTD